MVNITELFCFNLYAIMCKLTGFYSYLSVFKLGELLRPPEHPPLFH